ncbi:MAG: helix-turn-helix domain-containing protein [Deltaproteobacteria bacterium]|nr:helix-turn-helix domain-containing protein [Deltaproteobacteria bacterium]
MRWDEIRGMQCSVARTLSVIGDRWTLLVLRDAFLRTRRFEDFQRQLGVTRHLLADRLRKLVDAGILEKVRYQEKPARYEYRLTEKGRDLHPVIVSLLRWGDRWMVDDAGPPLTLLHRQCGHAMQPTLVCDHCREPVGPRDVAPAGALPRA